MRIPACLLAFALTTGSVPLAAQSLADAARKEQERRKTVKGAGKVFTNKDLKGVPPPEPPAQTTAGAEPSASDAAPAAPAPSAPSAGQAVKAPEKGTETTKSGGG